MNIERGPQKKRGFVIIDNSLAQDHTLSFGARGLGIYLLSLPTGVRVDIRSLAADNPEGRTAISGFMRELEEARYLVRTSKRVDGGRFETTCTMHEDPQDDVPESLPKPWSKAKDRRTLAAVPDAESSEDGTFSQVGPNPASPAFGEPGPGGPDSGDAGVNPYGVKEPGERTSSPTLHEHPTADSADVPGGGGGDAAPEEEEQRAAAFVDGLPYRGRIPGPKQRAHLVQAVAAALADGWPEDALRRQLTADTDNAKSMAAVYRYRLESENLPAPPVLSLLPEQRSSLGRPCCPECQRPLATGSETVTCRDCREDAGFTKTAGSAHHA